MKNDLTQKRLKELFHYNPQTGIFTGRTQTGGRAKKGYVAGCIEIFGYLRITVDKISYKSHRLAWLYVHGYFPESDMDHINRDKADNRIKNLRVVSKQCNNRNTGNPKNNKSGVKGVHWITKGKRWHAKIRVMSEAKYLGIYKDFDEAVCARLAGEQCLNWDGCDSSSPAYKYVQKMLKEGK